jgi:uncharacterized membrane protein
MRARRVAVAGRGGSAVSYDEVVSRVVDVVEGVGAGIMVVGALGAFVLFARQVRRRTEHAYEQLRRNVGRVILLGLEVLIIADIIRTIVVEPTFESVTVLGVIVVIRILLSFSLEVEIDGAWPWRRARVTSERVPEVEHVPRAAPNRAEPDRQ